MKRPSFQFYPADWQANSNLRRCSFEERGIWIEVICLLHDQGEYGIIRWPLKEIAQTINCALPKLKGIVAKGILKGVEAGFECEPLIYVPRSGRRNGAPVELIAAQAGPIWYSSRMVIDEHKRIIRVDNGTHAAPQPSPLPPKGETKDDTPLPTPFSRTGAYAGPSSSSTSSSTTKTLSSGESETTSGDELPADHPAIAPPLDGDPSGGFDAPASAPLPMREQPPISDDPAVQLSVLLRRRGVSANSTHPDVRDWAERKVPHSVIEEAVALAKDRKGNASIPPGYLRPIIDQLLAEASRTATPSAQGATTRPAKFDPTAHVNRNRKAQ